jgi:hypothetical protein
MKDGLKTFISAGLPFGIIMGIFVGIINNIYTGVIAGIFLGSLFGLLIGIFVSIQSKKFKKKSMDITDGKKTIMEGVANHFKEKESVGGWLCLTNDEIIFKSHNFNIQKHQKIIPLSQITSVKTSLTLGIVPNGLQITTNNDDVEKFVVNKRKDWAQKINEAISNQQR